MSTTAFDNEERTMLVLALLAYRGFEKSSLVAPNASVVAEEIAKGLATLKILRREWALAWGPVTHRPPLGIFDDSLVYVVRHRAEPSRYVIAVRGTNPISSFDWLFGDLWAGHQTPWLYGARRDSPEARVSLSTALGLGIVQTMRWSGPAGGVVVTLRQLADATITALWRLSTPLLQPISDATGWVLERLRGNLGDLVGGFARRRRALGGQEFAAQVKTMLTDEFIASRRQVLEGLRPLGDDASQVLLKFLVGTAWLPTRLRAGSDLLTFLRTAVAEARRKPLDIVVTGHSKGGALAPTLALWLADTQGTDGVPPLARWDPDGKAKVRCYSYAGPTAGNAAFTAHSDRVIGPHCHRIANAKDVVPHAWNADDLERIPDLYAPTVPPVPGMGDLARVLSRDMRPLGYRHVGLHPKEFAGDVAKAPRDFVAQLVHHHMEAYLEAAGLSPALNTDTFFGLH